jgi:ribosome-associated protein
MDKEKKSSLMLANIIGEIMLSKKDNDVVIMNLKPLPNTICDYFVVCHGNSFVQIQTIRDAVIDEVRKAVSEKPWHVEGANDSEWLLIDYQNVIVHIFLNRAREYYKIEDLWADAEFSHLKDTAAGADKTVSVK